MNIALTRGALPTIPAEHCGLLLRRGLNTLDTENGEQNGKAKQALLEKLARAEAPELYRRAYERWCKAIATDQQRFISFKMPLENRLYIGVTRDNPLETGITTHHCYGMPLIPGSAIKGVMRSAARSRQLSQVATDYLFGSAWASASMESGALIVHDAWWVPEGRPFVAEVITPHHGEYYVSEGQTPATDFDSPVPAPQIATQGSFLFALECLDPTWRNLAASLLKVALIQHGIGSKTTSGYGYFHSPNLSA